MPQYILKISADLENIQTISPIQHNLWKFDITDEYGGESKQGITVSTNDLQPLDGSRGDAHYIMRWNKGAPQSYIKILENIKIVKNQYCSDDSGKFVSILCFECRGIDVTKWIPGIDFNVQATSGKIFENIDLTELDWAEYDEENDLSVSITNLKFSIEKAK